MSEPVTVSDDLLVKGLAQMDRIAFPAASVRNEHFSSAAADRLGAEKAIHQFPVTYVAGSTAAVVAAATPIIHVAQGAGDVLAVKAILIGLPTTTDTVEIDLHKSSDGGATFATIATTTIEYDSSSTDLVAEMVLDADEADYLSGDIFKLVVTVSGTSATGLTVTIVVAEAPV